MKRIAIISIMLFMVLGAGCARNLYEGLRLQQEMNCQSLQGVDRDECISRSGMSYDEYQRQLKEREQHE